MQFAASFVEYLVTGCTALLWLIPLWLLSRPQDKVSLGNVSLDKYVLLLLPALYVVGMLVDSISSLLLKWLKPVARRNKTLGQALVDLQWMRLFRKGAPELVDDSSSHKNTALILYHSPELAKVMLAHSSRDRIARGALLNSLLAFFIALVGCWGFAFPLALLALSVGLFGMCGDLNVCRTVSSSMQSRSYSAISGPTVSRKS